MTPTYDVLTQLRREWRRSGRSNEARAAAAAFAARHPELCVESCDDLFDLVTLLERHGGRDVLARAAIARALLKDAADPLIHRALLQTLLPGAVSVCRQLRFGDGIVREPSETLAMAISLLSELLSDWAGESRTYSAPDILSALRGRLRRWLLKEKGAAALVSPRDRADDPAAASSPLATRLASYANSPYDRLARLTYARVFEGRSLRELARDDHSAPTSLQSELQHFALRFLL